MTDFKFGDLICYRGAEPHDVPLMYVGPCGHPDSFNSWGLIDILDIGQQWLIDLAHKDPSMWQLCEHDLDER